MSAIDRTSGPMPEGPFSVDKKGKLLFQGQKPKEVKELNKAETGIRSLFGSTKKNKEAMKALAKELNSLYENYQNTTLMASIPVKGYYKTFRVTLPEETQVKTVALAKRALPSPPPPYAANKENLPTEVLEKAKLGFGTTSKEKSFVVKDITMKSDGNFEVALETAGLTAKRTYSREKIVEMAQKWDARPDPAVIFIQHYVKEFLQPYVTGKAVPDSNREPLINRLEAAVKKEFPDTTMTKGRMQNIAFKAYLEEALHSYTQRLNRPMHPANYQGKIAPHSKEAREQFLQIFMPAISLDFELKFLKSIDLPKLVNDQLWVEFLAEDPANKEPAIGRQTIKDAIEGFEAYQKSQNLNANFKVKFVADLQDGTYQVTLESTQMGHYDPAKEKLTLATETHIVPKEEILKWAAAKKK